MLYIFLLMPLFAFSGNWSLPEFKTCSFYNAAAKATTCNNRDEYLSTYGEKYCLRFQNNFQSKRSGRLKTWAQNTGFCLQEVLFDNSKSGTLDCGKLKSVAFESHPVCYKQYGICDLSFKEQMEVLLTIDAQDLFSTDSFAQVVEVAISCLRKLL